MIVVNVYLHAREEMTDVVREANIANAKCSIKEPGIIRFDVMQQEDDPSRFLLVEIYKNEKAILAHRETEHFAQWVKVAEPMLAEPREKTIYRNLFPEDNDL